MKCPFDANKCQILKAGSPCLEHKCPRYDALIVTQVDPKEEKAVKDTKKKADK